MADPHQLFDDTSSSALGRGYAAPQSPPVGYPAQGSFLAEPMSSFAMAYGSTLASHSKEIVDKNVSVGPGGGERGETSHPQRGLQLSCCWDRRLSGCFSLILPSPRDAPCSALGAPSHTWGPPSYTPAPLCPELLSSPCRLTASFP